MASRVAAPLWRRRQCSEASDQEEAICAELAQTERSIYPNVVAEVDRMMTNLNLVAAGAGISVVSASMQHVHAKTVAYRPLGKSIHLNAPLTSCIAPPIAAARLLFS